jgi:hypothetical protein
LEQIKFFLDQEISPGNVWPDSIKNALIDADLMILVIGSNWLFLQDELSGKRRIDLENELGQTRDINLFGNEEK